MKYARGPSSPTKRQSGSICIPKLSVCWARQRLSGVYGYQKCMNWTRCAREVYLPISISTYIQNIVFAPTAEIRARKYCKMRKIFDIVSRVFLILFLYRTALRVSRSDSRQLSESNTIRYDRKDKAMKKKKNVWSFVL